jgi:hypothetical protein
MQHFYLNEQTNYVVNFPRPAHSSTTAGNERGMIARVWLRAGKCRPTPRGADKSNSPGRSSSAFSRAPETSFCGRQWRWRRPTGGNAFFAPSVGCDGHRSATPRASPTERWPWVVTSQFLRSLSHAQIDWAAIRRVASHDGRCDGHRRE